MPKDLTTIQLFLLTVCLAGVQFAWTVELAYGTPFLVSLGLSSSLTALVWIAGPLSGLLIQPIVGAYSDQLKWKYGRRKPFIAVGGILLIFSIILIGYNREISSLFFSSSDSNNNVQIGIAIFAFYLLDFSVNAVTCSCRSLIVDVTPLNQQQLANGWGAFQLGVGNIGGYLSGYLDLPAIFPFLGDTQIKCLCVINIIWLSTLLMLTLISVKEPMINTADSPSQKRWWEPLLNISRGIMSLPKDVQNVCNVQLIGWLGWFPFLFYWYNTKFGNLTYSTSWVGQFAPAGVSGERLGSLSLLSKSILSIVAIWVAPRMRGWNKIGLPQIWAGSFWLLGISLLCTYFVNSDVGAVAIPSIIGICWGLTQWVPFALIGEYVSNMQHDYERVSMENIDEIGQEYDPIALDSPKLDAGIVLGIHNIYIVIPQFISTFTCSILFKLANGVYVDEFGLVLRVGGIAAIFAGFLCLKVNEISRSEDVVDKGD